MELFIDTETQEAGSLQVVSKQIISIIISKATYINHANNTQSYQSALPPLNTEGDRIINITILKRKNQFFCYLKNIFLCDCFRNEYRGICDSDSLRVILKLCRYLLNANCFWVKLTSLPHYASIFTMITIFCDYKCVSLNSQLKTLPVTSLMI